MVIPKIRIESVFKATDNTCHGTASEAKLHECGLELRRKLIDAGFPDTDGKVKAIALELVKKYKEFGEVFDAVRRVNRSH